MRVLLRKIDLRAAVKKMKVNVVRSRRIAARLVSYLDQKRVKLFRKFFCSLVELQIYNCNISRSRHAIKDKMVSRSKRKVFRMWLAKAMKNWELKIKAE